MFRKYISNQTYQRFVTIEDAAFINELRTDSQLSRFLTTTETGIDVQIDWIKKYKYREEKRLEFYFITENEDGVQYGVNRIYNINNTVFGIGSWLFKRNAPNGLSILSDITTREYGFDVLNLDLMIFEVRKKNKSVINYHKLFRPNLEHEDELNYYFSLSKETFNSQKKKILKIYG